MMMHIHVWRRVAVHGPYTGSRLGLSAWLTERCRCGLTQRRQIRVRRITRAAVEDR